MKVTNLIQSYRDKSLVKPTLKGGKPGETSLAEDVLRLRLEKNSTFNQQMIVACMTILIMSFLLICLLIWNFIDDKTIVAALLGGEGLSVLFIIRSMRSLYKDKVFTDMLQFALPQLTTEAERLKYMEILADFLK